VQTETKCDLNFTIFFENSAHLALAFRRSTSKIGSFGGIPMSIVTKRGDQGTTSLMYGRIVSKCHPRVEAYGTVDELNAALGVARAACTEPSTRAALQSIQKHLVPIMGELATAPEDAERYQKEGYARFTNDHIRTVETLIQDLESSGVSFGGWAMPGDTKAGAALDLARTICRRAERAACGLSEAGDTRREFLVYLNRLSDLLWLLARKEDARAQENQ